jgi:hypothetical protein
MAFPLQLAIYVIQVFTNICQEDYITHPTYIFKVTDKLSFANKENFKLFCGRKPSLIMVPYIDDTSQCAPL